MNNPSRFRLRRVFYISSFKPICKRSDPKTALGKEVSESSNLVKQH